MEIYLDHNATTPVLPQVVEEMCRVLREDHGNPSSSHAAGRRARRAVEEARAEVARLLGASAEEVIFTAGGTESDNLALAGAAEARGKGHVVTCRGEHPAVLETCAGLEARGFRVTRLPLDKQGLVDPAAVERALGPDTFLISVMHSNNETGTLQPVGEIARLARRRGVLLHSDAAQSVGKVPVDVGELGIDLLTVAGHKLGAPKGVGALYLRRGVEIRPVLRGAGHERGLRPGTEAVHQVVGLGVACRLARAELGARVERTRGLRDLLHRLLAGSVPGLSLNGHPERRLPNTLNVNFPGVAGARLLEEARTVAASTGSACHEHEVRVSPVLEAMGVPPEEARGAVRLTLGPSTTREEVEQAARDLAAAHARLTRG